MVTNVDWLFLMHRLSIGKEALLQNFQVVVATKDTGSSNRIKEAGLDFVNLNMSRSGINVFTEIKLIFEMFRLYRSVKPEVVYHVTMKPVIYGSIISRILNINTVNAISGLGYNFTESRRGFVQNVMAKLMRLGFSTNKCYLLFENQDDYNELKVLGIVSDKNKVFFTKGVGADLESFKPVESVENEKLVILLPTRMLWDKGVKEFVDAALLLKDKYFGKVFFKLCGMIDLDNKEGIPQQYLEGIEIKDYLKWEGFQDDILSEYQNSDIVVLPSYREGMPTVLIEACAAGKPIVTTDAIGCRECVDEGLNGYKVPVKSIQELADAIEKLINSPEDRERMGNYARAKAEKEFDQKDFVKLHMNIFKSLLNQ
ncbi:glycosyltransferase family 4 protein [Flavobacterium ovatum]|uniref:glycosyltransferase family 4 protein n=1 Tax=Flavobacterium ovatum TaxID=1928857 RepID=UPI00344F8184